MPRAGRAARPGEHVVNRKPTLRRLVGAIVLGLSTAATAAPLTQDAAYQAILRDPGTVEVDVIPLDAGLAKASNAALGDDASLALDLGRGLRVEALRLRSHVTGDGVEVWQGLVADTADLAKGAAEIADDPRNSAILVRNGGKLTGSVRVDGQLYRIEGWQG